MRRRRQRHLSEEEAEVPMSPLIDCVFLLLIFFLVTSILKRKEKQVQIDLPDSTASVAAEAADDILVIGLDENGSALLPAAGRGKDGDLQWEPLPDLARHLKSLVEERGNEVLDLPLQINAHRDTPFQKAIDAIDLCKLQGFARVSVKTRQSLAAERKNP